MMIRKIFLVLILVFGFSTFINAQNNNLFFNIKGFYGDKAVLFSINGDNMQPIDTAYKQSTGSFVFFNIDILPTGVYSIYFNDSLYSEVIINKEEIVIRANANNLLASMDVRKSIENKILFDYWKYAMLVKDSIVYLEYQIRKIEQKTYDSNHPDIKKIENRINTFNKNIENYIYSQGKKYPDKFAPVLLEAYLVPDMENYNKANPKKKYDDEDVFLREHFFDNINFGDERFLQTKVLYTSINDYIQTYGAPASTVNYNYVIDKVMAMAVGNNKVYEYCLDLFIQTFEPSVYENVLVHLIDDYYIPYYTLSGVSTVYYSHLSERIKALKPGKKSPNFVLSDPSGVEYNLYKTKGKAKMIVFYSSDCQHCADALPSLLEIAEMYKSQGLVSFGVAIDDDEKIWKKEINKFSMKWISVSDLKGLSSPLVDLFNINSTPFILLLNEDNIIMKKPMEINDIHSTLVQLLNDI